MASIKSIIKRIYFISLKGYHTLLFLVNLLRDILGSSFSSFLNYYKRLKGFENKIIIGYDGYPFLEPLTGIGWYSYHLLEEFSKYENIKINLYSKTFILEENSNLFFTDLNKFKNIRIRIHGIPKDFLFGRGLFLKFFENFLTPLFILMDKNDLFFAPNYFPPPPFKVLSPIISTVHDCTFKVYPEFLQKETLENLNRYLPEVLYKAEKIISVSGSTKRDLNLKLNLNERKIKVIYHGNSNLVLRAEILKKKPYLLFVSTIEPRKNVLNIISAFEILKEKNYPFYLYLIGKIGWRCEDVLKKLKESRYRDFIIHLSYVKREELGSYYKDAFCLLFPSFYEGFGFPILEAFSMGCPVITSKNSSLEEIGEDGCLYVENDPDSIARGVIKLWENEDLRESLIEKGYEIEKKFKWEKTGKETLELFYNAIK